MLPRGAGDFVGIGLATLPETSENEQEPICPTRMSQNEAAVTAVTSVTAVTDFQKNPHGDLSPELLQKAVTVVTTVTPDDVSATGKPSKGCQ